MHSTYNSWLDQQPYTAGTVQTQMARAKKVEEFYGDLDGQYDRDELRGVVAELKYSAADERANKPNPSKILINGKLRTGLATYRDAVERYWRFRRETRDGDFDPANPARKVA